MGLTEATKAAPVTRRIWPITTLIVIVAFLLMAYQFFVCALQVVITMSSVFAPLFHDDSSPWKFDHVSAGMACLTTLPAFAAMIWCGWQRGSRLGLLLMSAPTAVMAVMASLMLDTAAFTSIIAALFDPLTLVNWTAVLLFGGFALATHLRRRGARHTENASAA